MEHLLKTQEKKLIIFSANEWPGVFHEPNYVKNRVCPRQSDAHRKFGAARTQLLHDDRRTDFVEF